MRDGLCVVIVAPTCKPNQTRVHGVAKQERASIECQVDANPPEVEFRWTFNNSAESLELDRKHVSMHGTSSTATYTPNIELDYGTLLCYASNLIGSQQLPCVYHIIPAGTHTSQNRQISIDSKIKIDFFKPRSLV